MNLLGRGGRRTADKRLKDEGNDLDKAGRGKATRAVSQTYVATRKAGGTRRVLRKKSPEGRLGKTRKNGASQPWARDPR